jgi:hypothetical protein
MFVNQLKRIAGSQSLATSIKMASQGQALLMNQKMAQMSFQTRALNKPAQSAVSYHDQMFQMW